MWIAYSSVFYLCRMDRVKILLLFVALATIVQLVRGQGRSRWGRNPCRHGSFGPCRRNRRCPTGSTCHVDWFGTRGRCCRNAPVIIEECRFGQRGICGGIAGLRCPGGTRCQFMERFPDGAGKCCNTRPPTDRCRFSSRGICGGFAGRMCPVGTRCQFMQKVPDGAGLCCITRPHIEECRFGQRGICGGFAGLRCPGGTRCQFMPRFSDGAGKCCITRPPTERCEYGQRGMCGGIAGLTCDDGYTCSFLPDHIPDGMGKCCQNQQSGVCPPPSGRVTTCQFDPARHCLEHNHCPERYLCCPEGCNRECKPAVIGPVDY